MKIYTRTGDDGTTGLLGGVRAAKDDPRIAAYGALDELNAALGVCRAGGLPPDVDAVVVRLQHELFALGAELASPNAQPRGITPVGDAHIAELERWIDRFDADLPALRTFILPGGSPAGAHLHAARCNCRRAEREIATFARTATVRPEVLKFINRLSDLLFVLARAANSAAGVAEVPWGKS
jgi:cob(I)alamin adenosyltransferase